VAAKNAYLDFVLEWLAPLGSITLRSMMGVHVLYCNGIVFALVGKGTLYLKVDDVSRPRYEALGLEPIQPFQRQELTLSFYPPPAEFFEDADALLEWGREAVGAGLRAKKKPGEKRKRSAVRRK